MKKIIALTAAMGLYAAFGAKKTYAWGSKAHKDITEKALQLLEKEKKARIASFYEPYKEQIMKGCTEPDRKGDIDKGAGRHYYSCVNSKGKELPINHGYYQNRLGKNLRSARTLLEENYTAALSFYKSGNTEEAMHYLGRAIHFIEDMGCTVHVSNMRYLPKASNPHYAFEKHIDTTCVKHTAERFDKRLTKSYEKSSFEDAANKLVSYSAKFVEMMSHLDPRAFDDIAKNTLPVTQQNVMALLVKFYNDCSSDNGNYVIDSKAYTFRNEASGQIITVTEKGLTLDDADKDKEQKLTVILKDGGTVAFKVKDGGFVNSKCSGYDYVKIDGQPALYRLAALGNRRFRITVGSADYERVLENSQAGKLVFSKFVPGNTAQNWILQ